MPKPAELTAEILQDNMSRLKDMGEKMDTAQEEIKSIFEEFKTANDAKDDGKADDSTNDDKLAKMETAMQKRETEIAELKTLQKKLEIKINRTDGMTGDADGGDEDPNAITEKKSWVKYLVTGRESLSQDEHNTLTHCTKEGEIPKGQKVLTVGNDVTGGYLAISEFVREIIKEIIEFSPIRSIASIRTTANESIMIPKRTAVFAALWGNERGSELETTGLRYGRENIPVHKLRARKDISDEDLTDTEFNLEAELRMEFAEQFAVAEGAAFVSGSGVGRPEGLLEEPDIVITDSAASGVLDSDILITVFYLLKDGYAVNGKWLMKRETIGGVRNLKDSDLQYLWQPGLNGAEQSTLLGKPIVEATDMPVIAAGAKSIMFGDFRRGYQIVDRSGMSMLRDPFTSAEDGTVRFFMRKRLGGQVKLADCLKILRIKA